MKPDVIVETGIAHGGSLIFYASLCKTMEKGRVVGVDIEIRPHNREAIEKHPLFFYITLIEGNAVSEDTFERVRAECVGAETTSKTNSKATEPPSDMFIGTVFCVI